MAAVLQNRIFNCEFRFLSAENAVSVMFKIGRLVCLQQYTKNVSSSTHCVWWHTQTLHHFGCITPTFSGRFLQFFYQWKQGWLLYSCKIYNFTPNCVFTLHVKTKTTLTVHLKLSQYSITQQKNDSVCEISEKYFL